MDSVPLGNDPDRREQNELLALFDAPAYIRRARGVEEALEYLLAKCRQQREEWLLMPRLRLGTLHALVEGDWSRLEWLGVDDDQQKVLEHLRSDLSPHLRVPPEPTRSEKALRQAIGELVASLTRFNERWREYLRKVDVKIVNTLRDGYNRCYYILEKACALRSDVLARQGFELLPPLDEEELLRHLPALVVPLFRSGAQET